MAAEWTRVGLNVRQYFRQSSKCLTMGRVFLPFPASGRRTLCGTCASREARCRRRPARTFSGTLGTRTRRLNHILKPVKDFDDAMSNDYHPLLPSSRMVLSGTSSSRNFFDAGGGALSLKSAENSSCNNEHNARDFLKQCYVVSYIVPVPSIN